MIILNDGTENVTRIIYKKSLSPESDYRLSLYTYLNEYNGRYLIRNILTGEVTELTAGEYEALRELKNASKDYAYLTVNGLTELAKKRYIVEKDHDEFKQYSDVFFLLKTISSGRKKGMISYLIFPTTACNARCTYCFEEGYEVRTMSKETTDRLVDHIIKTRHDGRITLCWFGGEPLLEIDIIRHICKALSERNVPYRSRITTNASLVTRELAHEMKESWKLYTAQISLDGSREDYAVRKNYHDPQKYNYDVVMRAAHYLSEEGIKVVFRVNVDRDNIGRIRSFLDDIKEEFRDMDNVSLFLGPLFQEQRSDHCIELYREIFKLERYMRKVGVRQNITYTRNRLRVRSCMADPGNIDKCVVITPDGEFYNCDFIGECRSWGNIFEGVTDEECYKELSSQPEADEKCRKCPFLPECTPFYKTRCPRWFEKCYEYKCLAAEQYLQNLLIYGSEETDLETDFETDLETDETC